MNKLVLFFTLCLHFSSSSQQLDSASVLAVVPFTEAFDNSDDNSDYGRIFAEKSLTAFEQSRRFILIDRTDFATVIKEVESWEGKFKGDFKEKRLSNDALYWYGNRLKADFIATGTISSIEAPISPLTGSYKANVGFSIKVINVRTNKVYVTENFSVSSGSITKIYSSKDEAIAAALANMVEDVKKFIDKYFPIYAKYERTNELNRSEMKKVTIAGGLDKGFRLGQKLDIVIVGSNDMPDEDIGDAEIISIQPSHSDVKITAIKRGLIIESIANKMKVLYFRSKAN